jgi:hypothetical protein
MWRVPEPQPQPVQERQEVEPVEQEPNYTLILSVMGMLCLTSVLLAMAFTGGSEYIGQMVCAGLVTAAYLVFKRLTRPFE